jgi:aminoglycoside phosphotransferase (APT) family kinase protein
MMEDLLPRGVRFCRAQQAHSYAEASAFLEAMARWHAAWWDHPALADDGELGWVGTTFDESGWMYAERYLEPAVWAHWMGEPRGQAVGAALRDRDRMHAALRALAATRASATPTLVHGDSHPGNLYIEADGRPGFLDAQMRRSPWVQDVAYHLTASLDLPDRPRWEGPLLAHYLRCLARHGVARPPDFDEAWDAYRREPVYGLFIFLINETRFQTEATNTAMAARFGAAVAQHRSIERLLAGG